MSMSLSGQQFRQETRRCGVAAKRTRRKRMRGWNGRPPEPTLGGKPPNHGSLCTTSICCG